MGYLVEVINGSNTNALLGFSKVMYEQNLNGTDWFDILIDDTIDQDLTNLAADAEIKITRDGTVDIIGVIDTRKVLTSGVLRVLGMGKVDNRLLSPLAPIKRNSQWTALTTSGVLGDVFAKAPSVTLSVTDSVAVTSFATNQNMKVLQALDKWCRAANQYYSKNHSTLTVTITNPTSSTSVGTLNEGIDFNGLDIGQDSKAKVKKVVVIGKGEGEAQITGSYSSGWVQGDAEEVITDKTIQSTAEANARAELEYNKLSATKNTYTFTVLDTTRNFTLGTVYTINSAKLGSVDLRVTSIKRTITQNGESLELEVRTVSQREAAEDRLKQIAEGNRTYGDGVVFDQGDTYSLVYNDIDKATSTDKGRGTFTLPSWITSSSQILSAKLIIERKSIQFEVPANTGDNFSNNTFSAASATQSTSATNSSAGGASQQEESGEDVGAVTISSGSFSTVGATVSPNTTTTAGIVIHVQGSIKPTATPSGGESHRTINQKWRVRLSGGSTYYPNSTNGIRTYTSHTAVTDNAGSVVFVRTPVTAVFYIPINTGPETFRVEMQPSEQVTCNFFITWWTIATHTHTANVTNPAHTNADTFTDIVHNNPISRAYNTKSESALTINYDINASTGNSAGSLSVDGKTSELDILSSLNNPATNRVNTLLFYPTSNEAVLSATIEIKAYREA